MIDDTIKKAMDEIKKNLEESFGAGIAARIIFSARDAASAPVLGMTKDHYLNFVKAVCCDDRVKEMWGDFGVKEKLTKWEKLA